MLIVGAVLAAGAAVWLKRAPQPTHTSVSDPLAIGTVGAGFSACSRTASWPTDLAWAPDGRRTGMIGFRQCGGPVGANATGGGEFLALDVGGMLGIWDATSGKRTTTVDLERSVIAQVVPQSVRSDATLLEQVQIRYDTVIWSPDGKSVAVMFNAFSTRPNTNGSIRIETYGSGLLLVDWRAGTIRVLQQPQVPQASIGLTAPIPAPAGS